MKIAVSVLELKLVRETKGKKSSHKASLENSKKGLNVSFVKKVSWKIIKIITKDGQYLPCNDHEVFLVRYTETKNKVESKTKSNK
jgi:hypothetical protein